MSNNEHLPRITSEADLLETAVEIVEGLRCKEIIDAKFIRLCPDGEEKPTNRVMLTFNSTKLQKLSRPGMSTVASALTCPIQDAVFSFKDLGTHRVHVVESPHVPNVVVTNTHQKIASVLCVVLTVNDHTLPPPDSVRHRKLKKEQSY